VSDAVTITVAVFHQEGCGHCEEYLPRFVRASEKFPDVPYVLCDLGKRKAERYAEQFNVRLTPTTMILRADGRHEVFEGALSDVAIDIVFLKAQKLQRDAEQIAR